MSQATATKKAVGMFNELVSFVKGIDPTAMSEEDMLTMIVEAKTIQDALNSVTKVGRAYFKPIVERNGGSYMLRNGEITGKDGSPRLSPDGIRAALAKRGMKSPDIEDALKESKGNPPYQISFRLNK